MAASALSPSRFPAVRPPCVPPARPARAPSSCLPLRQAASSGVMALHRRCEWGRALCRRGTCPARRDPRVHKGYLILHPRRHCQASFGPDQHPARCCRFGDFVPARQSCRMEQGNVQSPCATPACNGLSGGGPRLATQPRRSAVVARWRRISSVEIQVMWRIASPPAADSLCIRFRFSSRCLLVSHHTDYMTPHGIRGYLRALLTIVAIIQACSWWPDARGYVQSVSPRMLCVVP